MGNSIDWYTLGIGTDPPNIGPRDGRDLFALTKLRDAPVCQSLGVETGGRRTASEHRGPGLPEGRPALIMKDGNIYKNTLWDKEAKK